MEERPSSQTLWRTGSLRQDWTFESFMARQKRYQLLGGTISCSAWWASKVSLNFFFKKELPFIMCLFCKYSLSYLFYYIYLSVEQVLKIKQGIKQAKLLLSWRLHSHASGGKRHRLVNIWHGRQWELLWRKVKISERRWGEMKAWTFKHGGQESPL